MSSKRRKPRVTWLGRFVRRWRLDRNPLRRPSDRVETTVLAALLIAFAAAAPFVALACGTWAHALAQRAQFAQQASLYQVPAVVLKAPTAQLNAGYGALDPLAQARWTAPDGKVVTGEIPATLGTPAGATVRMWTTREGWLASPPLQDSQVAGQADLAAIAGVAALAAALSVTGVLALRALDKRRMAAWDADWLATGPRWTPRA